MFEVVWIKTKRHFPFANFSKDEMYQIIDYDWYQNNYFVPWQYRKIKTIDCQSYKHYR
jgi:hypothetical protein